MASATAIVSTNAQFGHVEPPHSSPPRKRGSMQRWIPACAGMTTRDWYEFFRPDHASFSCQGRDDDGGRAAARDAGAGRAAARGTARAGAPASRRGRAPCPCGQAAAPAAIVSQPAHPRRERAGARHSGGGPALSRSIPQQPGAAAVRPDADRGGAHFRRARRERRGRRTRRRRAAVARDDTQHGAPAGRRLETAGQAFRSGRFADRRQSADRRRQRGVRDRNAAAAPERHGADQPGPASLRLGGRAAAPGQAAACSTTSASASRGRIIRK